MSDDTYVTGRPVIVAVRQAERDGAALRWAAAEAASRHLPLRVVHAYEWQPGPVWAGRLRLMPDSLQQEARQAAATRLAEAVRECELAELGLSVTGVLTEGPVTDVLLTEARTAELLVLGSGRRAGVGTPVQSVAERAACPVTVIPVAVKPPARQRHRSTRVVIGLDCAHHGTAHHSDAALAFGFEFAHRWQAIVEVVNCWQPDLLDSESLLEPVVAAEQAALEEQLHEELAPWPRKYPELQVVASVLEHRPVAGLIERAGAADLLVLGRHGSHPVRALGSVHLAILRRAVSPVALVPSGQPG